MNKTNAFTETSKVVPGLVILKQRPASTQNVYWPNEEATDRDGQTVQVTIYFWDYQKNAGMAFLPGVKPVAVERIDGTLRIKEDSNG